MGHPYRQRHENGDYDKTAKTASNTGTVKQTTPKTTTSKQASTKP